MLPLISHINIPTHVQAGRQSSSLHLPAINLAQKFIFHEYGVPRPSYKHDFTWLIALLLIFSCLKYKACLLCKRSSQIFIFRLHFMRYDLLAQFVVLAVSC